MGRLGFRYFSALSEHNSATPIHVQEFWSDGRGPELRRILWDPGGTVIRAIEYSNPDWGPDLETSLRHVVFHKPQVVQITPEEAVGLEQVGTYYADYRPAGMFDLGRSRWLESFAPRHLVRCRHIQMFFYDELIDVICEGVKCGTGYAPTSD